MTNKQTTTFGLSPDKLASLLDIGADIDQPEDKTDIDKLKKIMLQERLAGTLPPNPDSVNSLSVILKHLYQELIPLGGATLGKVLQIPETETAVLEKIKQYGKKMVVAAGSETEKDTAIVIYYAAIASALINHGEKITQSTYKALSDSFALLRNKPWIMADLKKLFLRAYKCCLKIDGSKPTDCSS